MRSSFATLCAVLLVAAALAPMGVAGAGGAAGGATQENCSFPVTMTDASGTEVTLEERPERVTTLAASAAQTMWEIGGQSQVVGVTRYATYLDGAEAKENVSAGFGVSVEAVVGTEPDLVLAPNVTSADTVRALRDAGLNVYLFEMSESIEDVREKTTLIGSLTGNCEGAAETNAWMTANVEAAREATADREHPSVLYPLGSGYVANTNTFISAMIEVSGGTNAVGEANVSLAYPQLSSEVILQLEPDVLIITESNSYLISQQPYSSLAAVENNRTVEVDVNYLNQPAPRSVVYSVRNLTTGFHPDAEAEFVAKSEVTTSTETETPPPTDATFTATPTGEPESPTPSGGQSGFGIAVAVVALVIGSLARFRGR